MPWATGLLLLLSLGGTSPKPQAIVDPAQEIAFPQVANGVTGTLGLFTNMALTNPSDAPVRVDLSFWTPEGGPMTLILLDTITRQALTPVQSATNVFSFTIRAFETRYIETDGSGPLSVGWANAAAQSDAVIGGVAAYHFYETASGADLSIVSVGASAASGAFLYPSGEGYFVRGKYRCRYRQQFVQDGLFSGLPEWQSGFRIAKL